jgi:DNA-binding NarL/FixJ family response regulator
MVRKVLIVDDSKLARMAIVKVLGSLYPEWTRLEAAEAEAALEIAGQTAIDITLLDFNMPGRDGLSLASDLLKLYPGMPVAVISANHQDEVVRRAGSIGAAFLSKPLTEKALAAFLVEAVQQLGRDAR